MLLTLIALAMCAVALVFVLSPLWRSYGAYIAAPSKPDAPPNRMLNELLEQREAALSGLAELDFDRTLGNLSDADYENLRLHYRAQAIGVLKAVDEQAPPLPAIAVPTSPIAASRAAAASSAATFSKRSTSASARPEVIASPVSKRALAIIGGLSGLGVLAIAVGSLMLRGSITAADANTPTLGVLHTHSTLLVPGTQLALVAHHEGLLRSTDAGLTWGPVAGVTGDVLALAGGGDKGKPIYLATLDRLMRSADGGASWQAMPLPTPGAQVSAMVVGGNDALYAFVPGSGLFRTANSKDWEPVGSNLPSDVTSLVWWPSPMSAFFAVAPSNGVMASGDGGKTWGSSNGVLNGVLPGTTVRSVAFDPISGDRFTAADGMQMTGALYISTDLGIFKSIDGGSSWVAMPLQEPLVSASVRSSPSPLLLGFDARGRVWRSTDRGSTWSPGR